MGTMNLADPDLELIDPTPNVHALFLQFDKIFFYTKLASRAVVRWSKRMYSCAGICSYDRGGLCDIALSEPLLKLRPRKDLVETLLHEMIHAFLFITNRDQDRDGHGPNFKEHMYRINKAAGLNISIYHDFHDEVKLYQTHWWRCNGPCQTKKPHFGIVRRSMNRAPGPYDYWWTDHQRKCGGTFVKIKEPEKPSKKKAEKPVADITKYLNNNVIINNKIPKSILKDANVNKSKANKSTPVVVSKKNTIVFNPKIVEPFVNQTNITVNESKTLDSSDVAQTVRNIWANKQLPTATSASQPSKIVPKRSIIQKDVDIPNCTKSPPKKIMKIDDYFKSNATNVLKDIYGQDFSITQSKNDAKLVAVPVTPINLVNCPICNIPVNSDKVNSHLDECLNRDAVIALTQSDDTVIPNISNVDIKVVNKQGNINKDCSDKDLSSKWQKPVKQEYPMTKIDIKIEPNNSQTKVETDTTLGSDAKTEYKNVDTDKETTYKIIKNEAKEGTKIKSEQVCPCCGVTVTKSMEEHLDECLAFFDSNATIPEEGASTSFIDTIVIDDDDLDETMTLNETGTKTPCPCCMRMVEMAEMNTHLDVCLLSD